MSTRERWIVYPLLFLALGASIKSHIVRRFECDTLVVSNIEIVDRHGRLQGMLAASPDGAVLTLHGQDGRGDTKLGAGRLQTTAIQATVVQASLVNSNSIGVSGSDGKPQATLEATTGGVGRLRLFNINDKQFRTLRAPGEPLVPPVKVDGKQQPEKKPEPKK